MVYGKGEAGEGEGEWHFANHEVKINAEELEPDVCCQFCPFPLPLPVLFRHNNNILLAKTLPNTLVFVLDVTSPVFRIVHLFPPTPFPRCRKVGII